MRRPVHFLRAALPCLLAGLVSARSFAAQSPAPDAPAPPQRPAAEVASGFAIQTWSTEDGLPQNMVTAILQTRAGYLWAATYNGIAQFDGVRFTVFDASTAEGLPNSRITSLFEDARGDIWIGHDTGEITRYSEGIFHPVPLRVTWNGGTIAGICADEHGDIWCAGLRGDVLRLKDGLAFSPPPDMAAEPTVMPELASDARHRLFMARNGGVAELTRTGFRPIAFPTESARPYYSRVTAARVGGWWVSGDGRVRRWADNAWQEDLGPFPWGDGFVVTMLETAAGQLLVGTLDRGVFLHAPGQGWTSLDRSNGLPHDWIRCVAEDRERNIWLATGGGLAVLRPRKVTMYSPPDQWQGRPVQAITLDRNGALWAATEGAGIYRFQSNSWAQLAGNAGLSNSFVWTVMQDSAGTVWAGTWGGGLFRWDGSRFVRQFDLAERGEPVTALLESPPGTLWIGSSAGLLRLRQNRLERLAPLGGAAAGDVRALAPASGGAVWVGTQGRGLGRIKDGKLQTFTVADGLPRNFVLSLYEEPDETLWIGTLDRGICRFRNGRFASITTDQGLPNNVIGHIADDGLGNLWFSSQKGLFRITKKDLNDCADHRIPMLQPLIFGKAEGLSTLASSSGFTPSGFRSPDGRLWFPTAQGIAVIDPKSVSRNLVPPQVWIEEVLVDGQRAAIGAPLPSAAAPGGPGGRSITLDPGHRRLDISFTGISFTSPGRVLFRYRLEGLDEDWSEPSAQRRVTYPFLPPGRYAFHATACNSDGLWNHLGDSINIVMLPHVWQTWWFKVAAVAGGFALVGLAVQLGARRRHRLKLERLAREHELERERARIAQDIHDDLGASLTRIGMLSQSASGDLQEPDRAASQLNDIYLTACDLTRAMDEIVWAINPRHDTLESLVNYLTRFAHGFLSAAHIRCRIEAAVKLPDLPVHSEIRHNLFLAVKEILNNAVKHSGASEVRLLVEVLPGQLKLAVVDNGHGFEPGKSPAAAPGNRLLSGYGMAGIQTRLSQISGRVEIASDPATGTRVDLLIPIPGMRAAPATESAL